MQRPSLFESDCFIYWKNRFETYVKAKDLDLWHIILIGDFPPVAKNEVTQILEVVPFEQQDDDLKRKLAKNNEAKMVLYNTLPKKDLKALDEGFSSKNYVRKFFRALHPKWRAKVTAIEKSKDLSSLALDELIGNLKVHEVVMEKDSEIYRGKKERVKSIALKTKKESSDDETLTSVKIRFLENEAEDKTNDETYLMAQSSNEVTLESSHYSDNDSSLDDDSMQIKNDNFPPPTKLSPLVDDDVGEEEAIENNTKVVNNSNVEDSSIEVDKFVNIKESKNHPL
ncbi:hypothetical protein Tco_1284595 [Tanacetum coccineum]